MDDVQAIVDALRDEHCRYCRRYRKCKIWLDVRQSGTVYQRLPHQWSRRKETKAWYCTSCENVATELNSRTNGDTMKHEHDKCMNCGRILIDEPRNATDRPESESEAVRSGVAPDACKRCWRTRSQEDDDDAHIHDPHGYVKVNFTQTIYDTLPGWLYVATDTRGEHATHSGPSGLKWDVWCIGYVSGMYYQGSEWLFGEKGWCRMQESPYLSRTHDNAIKHCITNFRTTIARRGVFVRPYYHWTPSKV